MHWEPSIYSLKRLIGTLLPGIVSLIVLICDFAGANFITLDDLEDPVDVPAPLSVWKVRVLGVLALVASVSWFADFVYASISGDAIYAVQASIAIITWGLTALRIIIKQPLTTPYLLISFALLQALAGVIVLIFHTSPIQINLTAFLMDIMRLLIPVVFIWVAGSLPLQPSRPGLNVARPDSIPSVSLTCPEDDVTLWQWLTFSFVQPLLNLASSKTLNENDVWSLSPFFKHRNIFRKCLEYRSRHPTHSLLRFLVVSNSLDLILDIALELWYVFIGFLPPYALKEILSALGADATGSKSTAYFWAIATFLAHLSFAQVDLLQRWHTRRCYERTRGQLFCTLHYKSLTRCDVSGKIEHDDVKHESADLGKIVNLMQGDAYAVSQRFWEFSGIFTSPIRLIIALVFLYQILGWTALAGVAVVLLAYMTNYPLAQYNIHITRSSWIAKDRRMSLVNELLQNIRFLKFYGWENYWSRKARESREVELNWRVKENIVDTLMSFTWTWMPSATALSCFACYTIIAGEKLTVSKAFTSIALFSQLQEPMTALPGQVFAMLHAYVSMQRIEEFLAEQDVPDWASSLKTSIHRHVPSEIRFSAASFEFHRASKVYPRPACFQLGPLDITFPKGQLSLVSGATGSGKSALLAALLGEMRMVSGSVHLDKQNHNVAYCAQTPWLEHATIRDNIIFGCKYGYDEVRYKAVVKACALARDLEVLDSGDMTEIGEKGITLSGGQRARISLARAIYSEADCVLLDDPLAAVDMHTAQHILRNCLTGDLVRGRTIILVTHHIRLCVPAAAYFVELSQGTVLRQGSIRDFEDFGELKTAEKDIHAADPLQVLTATDTMQHETDSPIRSGSKKKVIEEETRAEGQVSLLVYLTYMRAAGPLSWILTILLMLLILSINVGNQVFLAKWGEAYNDQAYPTLVSLFSTGNFLDRLPSPNVDVRPWLLIYFYLSMIGAITVLLYISIGYYASLRASRSLFISLLERLTKAPVRFFDVTPIGRILNRFTTDINTVDGALQNSARAALSGVLYFLVSFCVIVVVIPNFSPFALIIAFLYVRLAPPYINASRDLRRLESVALSPAFAGYDELLRGLVHIRAFGMETRYQNTFYQKVDKFQSFDHAYWLVANWLRWRYDCLGSVVVFLTTLFVLWNGLSSGLAAIAIVQAGIFAEASRQLVRVCAQLELDFNAVERIIEYLNVPQEAPSIIPSNRPPAYWPSSHGGVVVQDLSVRYAPDMPSVLRNLSFTIKASEKIGVVGRTGSGKSTLVLSFLRMVEPCGGKIIIDGIDISTIGLEDLRTRITIVSQDVSLFSGTLRSNLDPFEEHTDQECWEVLERCHLTSLLSRTTDKQDLTLAMPMSRDGSLSAGERQLVALARAILRRTNIIVMDEATSQIDSQLDDQIQKTIREELSDVLVITVAHRLKTIIDYDRILVLDDGKIVEFGEPRVLFSTTGSAFREMCRGSADWSFLAAAVSDT